jgi:class 3 adenylate cyclase
VSDTERERVVDRLKSHLADGRLSVEEFSDRAAEAYAARTVGDLRWVLRELPADARAVAEEERVARREWQRHVLTRFVMPNVVCVGVWAAAGGGPFWPVWVLFGTGVGLTRRLLRGPSRSHEDEPPALKDGRVLTTCLFVDVVGSTELAAQLGDERWSELLRQHHRNSHDCVTRRDGHEIFTRGAELVAGFDSASRAISCARDLRAAASALGLEVRAGLHAGEVHRHGNDVSGIALHIGQRVSALAEPGEILVSSTVRDMATGSDIEFESRGETSLKGVPGSWVLYAVTDDPA